MRVEEQVRILAENIAHPKAVDNCAAAIMAIAKAAVAERDAHWRALVTALVDAMDPCMESRNGDPICSNRATYEGPGCGLRCDDHASCNEDDELDYAEPLRALLGELAKGAG